MMKKFAKLAALSMSLLLFTSTVLLNTQTVSAAEVTVPNKIGVNVDVARTIAEEGMVLLKNEGMLPLKSTDEVVGLGAGQDEKMVYGGKGSGNVLATNQISYLDGLKKAESEGYIQSYIKIEAANETPADKALYFISRDATENADNIVSSYYLTTAEKNDVRDLINVYGAANVGVILNCGSVMDTTWLISQNVGAIVVTYYAGEQAGTALANLLVGKSNFSGKTVDTWAKDYNDYPSASIGTFAGDINTYYTEDIYVGYRYFETFDPNYEKVNYEFGYGLSYTKFNLTNKTVKISEDYVTVNVTVKNVGNYAGKEVVQVYYAAPQGDFGNPARELAGFAKTDLLKPGESQNICVDFNLEDMAVYDDTGVVCDNSWILLKGDYKFYVGNSVKNAAEKGRIDKAYNVKEDKVLSTTSELLPTQLQKRLLADGSYQDLYDVDALVHTVKANGANVIQAEKYYKKSQSPKSDVFYIGEHVAYGMGNMNNGSGEWLEYELYVEKGGTYKMAFSMSSNKDVNEDMFRVWVNGEESSMRVNMGKTANNPINTEDWYKCTLLTDPAYTVELPEGRVKIRLRSNENKFQNIDYFLIYNNAVSLEDETVIEAETANSTSTGMVQIANGMATAVSNTAGSTYTYTLNAERAGKYGISLLASNVSFASQNSVKITVNGVDVQETISLKRTDMVGTDSFVSNNYTFTKTDSVMVDLIEGENTVTFTTLDASLTCLDKFYVCPVGSNYIVTDAYEDNTDDFDYDKDLSGAVLEEFITFNDVVADTAKLDAFVSQMSIEELANLLSVESDNNTAETGTGGVGGYYLPDEYGIPNANTADGPAGIRYLHSFYATFFPCMTLLASTWNMELAQEFGVAVGSEAKLGNVQVWLAPGVNIHRNPLCGRNFEYYSEDPFVSAMIGKYVTIGAQSTGVSVCVKHFVANEQETNRYSVNSCVSNRALREIYFKPFEIIVKEAKPYALMSSYNKLNGEYVGATYEIITGMLYEEWGFEGAIFGDWNATITHTSYVQAGHTFKSLTRYCDNLVEAYRRGVLSREQLEYCAKDVIRFLITSDSVIKKQTVINADATYLDVNKSRSWEYTKNGETTYLYRLYMLQDCKYILKVNENENYKILFDGQEIVFEDGEFVLDCMFGKHDVIVQGASSAINELQSIELVPYTGTHAHRFVEGLCTLCEENDPNYQPAEKEDSTENDSSKEDLGSVDDFSDEGCSGKISGLAVVLTAMFSAVFVVKKREER